MKTIIAENMQNVGEFKRVGMLLSLDDDYDKEIKKRVAKAAGEITKIWTE